MTTDNRVRIEITVDSQKRYFVRFADDPRNKGFIIPETVSSENLRRAALMSRDFAVPLCRNLRQADWQARIVTPNGIVLYEEQTAPPPPSNYVKPQDRVPHYVGNLLIVPGNPNGWFIRFPGTAFESIFAETPDECYRKLIDHPRSSELQRHAEKYVVPEVPPVTPVQVLQAIERERYRNLRPGDRRG
jgi:hypothetical protein